jgi:hypothetical protein
MDLRAGDTVASVAVIREGRLSQVNGEEDEETVEAEAVTLPISEATS